MGKLIKMFQRAQTIIIWISVYYVWALEISSWLFLLTGLALVDFSTMCDCGHLQYMLGVFSDDYTLLE